MDLCGKKQFTNTGSKHMHDSVGSHNSVGSSPLRSPVASPITDMTLEEQIGQILMVGFHGLTPTPEIIDLIQNYHIGGVILFSRNVQDTQQVLHLTRTLQEIARAAGHRFPLLISIDQENGMVNRLGYGSTVFPGNMALGAIGSEQVAHDVALATGQELHALGLNMNLAPVVDVNNNPANPVIGVRSFGEDPQLVARLGAAMVKGYHEAGVISCLKHFPGHGDTAVDSHLALPIVPHAMQRLEAIELVPFKSGIAAGATAVMTAHVSFPALTQRDDLPATLSPTVLTGLLREKLGFEGVIITDCLEMNAISKGVGIPRGSVMTLQAGADLVLISHIYEHQRAGFEAIRTSVKANELSPDIVRQAAERVLHLKERYLSWESLPDAHLPPLVGGAEHQQLRDRAYNLSTTLVKNEDALIPLHLAPNERILVITHKKDLFAQVQDRGYADSYLPECIRQYHQSLDTLAISDQPTAAERQRIQQAIAAADIILMATMNANLDQQQATFMRDCLASGKRVIGIGVGNPYDLLAFPQLRTYLATYEYTVPAIDAAARVLFGKVEPQGHLPVTLTTE